MTATIWAISDLHLSFANPKRGDRTRYASRWRDHAEAIATHWRAVVGPDDLVLLPGDVSMARTHREVQPDLVWLDRLPGTKVLSPGNHDRWWNGVAQVRPMLRRSLRAVEGDALATHGVIVCGARGAAVPSEDIEPTAPERHDATDELKVLEHALEHAQTLRLGPDQPVYVLWHFPPFDPYGRPGPWVERMTQAGVTACLFGHLHTESQWAGARQGTFDGVRFLCVAADAVGFRPLPVGRGDP